jgi:hypothetical protein
MLFFNIQNTFTLFVIAGPSVQYGLPLELSLQFITEEDTNGQPNEYIITDIEDFKNGLFIYPVHRICP